MPKGLAIVIGEKPKKESEGPDDFLVGLAGEIRNAKSDKAYAMALEEFIKACSGGYEEEE